RGSPGSKQVPKERRAASRVATTGDARRRGLALAGALPDSALFHPGRGDRANQRPARERVTEVVEKLDDDDDHGRDMQGRREPEDKARHRNDVAAGLDETGDRDER